MENIVRLNENEVIDSLETIQRKNRSTKVYDHDYGRIETINAEERDKPIFAVFEYDKNGNIISEDYSKLINVLEERIIPKYSKIKYVKKPQTNEEVSINTISGSVLVRLKLSEKEYKFVLEYLTYKGIIIQGKDSSLDCIFDGYKYMSTYKTIQLPEPFDMYKNFEYFYEYNRIKKELESMKEDAVEKAKLEEQLINVRNAIVEGNMRMVCDIVRKQMPELITKSDEEDIYQIAYEVLYKYIENFNVELGYAFSSYIYNTLMFEVIKKYSDYKSFRIPLYLAENFRKLKELQNRIYMTTGRNATVEELSQYTGLSKHTVGRIIQANQAILVESYDAYQEDKLEEETYEDFNDDGGELVVDEMDSNLISPSIYLEVISEELKETLNNILGNLYEKERAVLRMLYGFDGDIKKYSEVSKELNLSIERVRAIELKALRKLRHPRYSRYLREYYYNGNEEESINVRKCR